MKWLAILAACAGTACAQETEADRLADKALQEISGGERDAGVADLRSAIAMWEAAASQSPKYPIAMLWAADLDFGAQDFSGTEALLDKVQAIYDRKPPADERYLAWLLELRAMPMRISGHADEVKNLLDRAKEIRQRAVEQMEGNHPPPEGARPPGDRGVDQKPTIIYKVDPDYAPEARFAKYEGTVILACVIDEKGNMLSVRLVRSLGLGLDEKAAEAALKWRFRPGTVGGNPVKVAATIEINFKLIDGA